jgi:hypothetical protein
MVSDPEECQHILALPVVLDVDFRWLERVVLPGSGITGLNPFNLSAYGLRAR